jgi:FeS assembly SUF system regulator
MIRMAKLTDYAIVLLAHLAQSGGRTLTAQELSTRSHVPMPTVSKLCKELSKAGLVRSQRGRHGGYDLARSADQISVAEIVELLEGPIGLTECSSAGNTACLIEAVCPARDTWDPVARAIQGALAGLPLSAIAPFRIGVPPAPADPTAPVPVTLGVHA